jgi:hypothetical protein
MLTAIANCATSHIAVELPSLSVFIERGQMSDRGSMARAFWRGVQVCSIIALGLVGVLAWLLRDSLGHGRWLIVAAVVGALLVLQSVAQRHALGWIVDHRGERQKVVGLNRSQAIYTDKTWNQRVVEEETERSKRRISLLWSTPVGWGLMALAFHISSGTWGMKIGVGIVSLIVLGGAWVGPFFREVLYLSGYQDMAGAKVLDRPPVRPGIGDVARQKVHGDASVANEDEALGLLNSRHRPRDAR